MQAASQQRVQQRLGRPALAIGLRYEVDSPPQPLVGGQAQLGEHQRHNGARFAGIGSADDHGSSHAASVSKAVFGKD